MRFPQLHNIGELFSVWGRMALQYEKDYEALKPRTGQVTLTPSATTTTLSNPALTPTRKVFFTPTTASAITAFAGLRVATPTQGQVVITHPSNAAVDQILDYAILGS